MKQTSARARAALAVAYLTLALLYQGWPGGRAVAQVEPPAEPACPAPEPTPAPPPDPGGAEPGVSAVAPLEPPPVIGEAGPLVDPAVDPAQEPPRPVDTPCEPGAPDPEAPPVESPPPTTPPPATAPPREKPGAGPVVPGPVTPPGPGPVAPVPSLGDGGGPGDGRTSGPRDSIRGRTRLQAKGRDGRAHKPDERVREKRERRRAHRAHLLAAAGEIRSDYRSMGPYTTESLTAEAARLRRQGATPQEIAREVYAPFIIAGPASWTDTWGAPRYGPAPGQIRQHEGQDVFCRYGDPVLASEDGTVEFDEQSLGGRIARLHRPDGGYWYYAHLSDWNTELSDGDVVRTGDIIGYCGNTGNASSTPAHVHFGWYGPDGEARDPMGHLIGWLRAAADGRPITGPGPAPVEPREAELITSSFGDVEAPQPERARTSSSIVERRSALSFGGTLLAVIIGAVIVALRQRWLPRGHGRHSAADRLARLRAGGRWVRACLSASGGRSHRSSPGAREPSA